MWRFDVEGDGNGGYDDGRLIVYSRIYRNLIENGASNFLYMRGQNWYHSNTLQYKHFICEKETGIDT